MVVSCFLRGFEIGDCFMFVFVFVLVVFFFIFLVRFFGVLIDMVFLMVLRFIFVGELVVRGLCFCLNMVNGFVWVCRVGDVSGLK